MNWALFIKIMVYLPLDIRDEVNVSWALKAPWPKQYWA
jgi:hypothetical protein